MNKIRNHGSERGEADGRLGFHLLVAPASVRQASSETARAVAINARNQPQAGAPDQHRIQLLASRAGLGRSSKPTLARFSDVALPLRYAGVFEPLNLNSRPKRSTT